MHEVTEDLDLKPEAQCTIDQGGQRAVQARRW